MTREEVARKIHWDLIIWIFGFINVGAMLPQLFKIIITQNVEGLSVAMFIIYFCGQVAFSLQGFFRRDRVLMWCLGMSATVTLTILVSIPILR